MYTFTINQTIYRNSTSISAWLCILKGENRAYVQNDVGYHTIEYITIAAKFKRILFFIRFILFLVNSNFSTGSFIFE